MRSARRRSTRGLLLAAAAGCALAVAPVSAEERWVLEGFFDTGLWETDPGSRLLSRNEGDATATSTLRLWLAGELTPSLQIVVASELEGESGENGTDSELEQAALRYTFRTKQPLFLEAGRIVGPLGNFSARYLPSSNPLIGEPTTYSVSYPLGAQLAGSLSWFDFRAALVDLPLTNASYLPEPGSALRPAIAAGVNPLTGLRLGAYFTRGPYLSRDLAPTLPEGSDWKDYDQRIAGFDFQFSRGHLELNGDYAMSMYEVPTFDESFDGRAYFAEAKYTWTPRLFTAVRLEGNRYVYAAPDPEFGWVAALTTVRDYEVGVGFRFGPRTILKLSYREDSWSVDPAFASFFPDGHALALQVSQAFDVRSWFERER